LALFERARIEVYVPDLPDERYQGLLEALDREFTHSFGGCTIQRGLDGSYLSRVGLKIRDRINLIHTDTPLAFERNLDSISRFSDELRKAAFEALEEEAILVVCFQVYRSE